MVTVTDGNTVRAPSLQSGRGHFFPHSPGSVWFIFFRYERQQMKKIFLALVLSLCVAWPARAGDYQWFVNEIVGFELPDGWECVERGNGLWALIPSDFQDSFILMSQPNPASDQTLTQYTGIMLGTVFIDLSKMGAGKVTSEQKMEFDGYPAMSMQFQIEKDGQITYAGLGMGTDYNGYYVTMIAVANVHEANQFMPVAMPIMESFTIDFEEAEDQEDFLTSTGRTLDASLKYILQQAENRQK